MRCLKIADREDGLADPTSSTPAASGGGDLEAENRELRKRREVDDVLGLVNHAERYRIDYETVRPREALS